MATTGGRHIAGQFLMIGHRFDVRCPDQDLASELTRTLSSVACDGTGPRSRYVVTPSAAGLYAIAVDGQTLCRSVDLIGAVDAICTEANRRAINTSREPAVLHAGAVVRDGKALVIAGESGSGKTTLVTRLMSEGWLYLTDEAVQVTNNLEVVPYPKPLVIKGESKSSYGRAHVPPSEYGEVCDRESPVHAVLILGSEARSRGHQAADLARLCFAVSGARSTLSTVVRLAGLEVRGLPPLPSASQVSAALVEVLEFGGHTIRPPIESTRNQP